MSRAHSCLLLDERGLYRNNSMRRVVAERFLRRPGSDLSPSGQTEKENQQSHQHNLNHEFIVKLTAAEAAIPIRRFLAVAALVCDNKTSTPDGVWSPTGQKKSYCSKHLFRSRDEAQVAQRNAQLLSDIATHGTSSLCMKHSGNGGEIVQIPGIAKEKCCKALPCW